MSIEEKNSTDIEGGITDLEIEFAVLVHGKSENPSEEVKMETINYRNKMGKLVQRTGPFTNKNTSNENNFSYLHIKKCLIPLESLPKNKLIVEKCEIILTKKYKKKIINNKSLPLNIVKLTQNYYFIDMVEPEIISMTDFPTSKSIRNDFLSQSTLESEWILYRKNCFQNKGMEVMDFNGKFLDGNSLQSGSFLISDVTFNALGDDLEDHKIHKSYSPFEEGLCIIDLIRYEAYYLKKDKKIKILKLWRSGSFEFEEAFLDVEKDEKPKPGKDDQIIKVLFIREGQESKVYEGTLKKTSKLTVRITILRVIVIWTNTPKPQMMIYQVNKKN